MLSLFTHIFCMSLNKLQRVNRRTRKAEPAPAAAAAAEDKEPKRAQRTTSNVFAVLNQNQIQEFKEVEQ